jgi:hypothetical protein
MLPNNLQLFSFFTIPKVRTISKYPNHMKYFINIFWALAQIDHIKQIIKSPEIALSSIISTCNL